MIPKILHEASRQYRHNSSDELVSGFDKDETIKIVTGLQAEIDELKQENRLMWQRLPEIHQAYLISAYPNMFDKHKGE